MRNNYVLKGENMKFKFTSSGKLVNGLPFAAKIYFNEQESFELQREYIKSNISISNYGDVSVSAEYEANNFDIIEERYGSCNAILLSSYNLVYRNKLILLGASDNESLNNDIIDFLEGKISVIELLDNVDNQIKKEYKEEIEDIFNKENYERVDKKKNTVLNINEVLKEFIEDNKYINLIFNDYHIIFNSDEEKIIMNFINKDNIYIETKSFKLNIKINSIENFKVYNKKKKFNKIELYMTDGTNIILSV